MDNIILCCTYCGFKTETVFQYDDKKSRLHIQEGVNDECSHERKSDEIVVWLPRQDQLQEMLPKKYLGADAMFSDLVKWIEENDDYLEDYFAHCLSAEIILLAFVMKEKFNKTWNGEDWINA